jgi:chromosome segregation ATPase
MTLTRLIYTKEEDRLANLQAEAPPSNEAEQILHLKRLLVTLKQHYEKTLLSSQVQFQSEQNQRIALQKELDNLKVQLTEGQKCHEEELQALRDQQTFLKDLLKKAQDELSKENQPSTPDQADTLANRQRMEQLERVIPYLRGRTEEANLETEQLREDLDRAQKKLKVLEQELIENKQNAQRETEHFQQLLAEQQEDQVETVVSSTSSHQLRRELEDIKRNLIQGNQDTKAVETRYIEILNEKIGLEHQCKQMQLQLEHQSSNLTAFQTQLHEMEDHNKALKLSLQAKETELEESSQQSGGLKQRIKELDERVREKEYIQDKYEQLKDEWNQLGERLDEAVEVRSQTEQHLIQLETIAANQETQLQELEKQFHLLDQEKQTLEVERAQIKILLEESETRLKIAQQHLAKKVKEAAFLSEKVDEQQGNIADFLQNLEQQKNQFAQLQASVDLYQRQEKRMQEQLHDALKGNESQATKWEEKYFHMYDKWQESENKIRELKKFEEKHHQMQSLLVNLGSFMGGPFNNPNSLFQASQEAAERSSRPSFDSPPAEMPSSFPQSEEKYDLFGMRQPHDKNPHLFS